MSTYCDIAPGHEFHGPYHDTEYGFPLEDDDRLFERLSLEIFQAGLSWLLVLKKRDAINAAFEGFRVSTVAGFTDKDVDRLCDNSDIIRNRLKINAIIHNAQIVTELQNGHGSFAAWLEAEHPKPLHDWVKLFKKTFKFTGGEICNEFLMSIGYLPGAHVPTCPVYRRIATHEPAWMKVPADSFEPR